MSKYDVKMVLNGFESAADAYAAVSKAIYLGELDPQSLLVTSQGDGLEDFEFPAIQSAIKGLSNGPE